MADAPSELQVGDINEDGRLDILAISPNDDSLSILYGGTQGSLNVGPVISTVSQGSAELADFNGDGQLDIVSANGGALVVLLGAGDGTFTAGQSFSSPGAFGLSRPSTGDFNNDGVLDIVASDPLTDSITLLLGNATAGIAGLLPFSLATKSDALQAMAPLDRKIEQLALQKGTIGAFQSRVEVAINNLQITSTTSARLKVELET